MFTGIVEGVGRIVRVESLGADAGGVSLAGARVGDSIAVNGACMTITSLADRRFTVDVSRESLARTVGLDAPGEVNLETALALGDKLGGHLVSGHVDGVGEVARFAPVGESWDLVVRAPRELAKYFAYKGSVAVDGVSLTVNRVTDTPAGCELAINLIPHTIEVTTLKRLAPGARVNLEVDLIARYVERMLAATTAAKA
ncbi:MAG: riboflavin synthase [Burkholderiaceae bacterium]|nr:riboflavin synthase [Burkholderiaceae bacterium]